MASEEIGEINSSSCIIQVDYEGTINEEDLLDVGEARIFKVSKPLRDSDRFYSPKLVSIGPFHYGKEELKAMEKSKFEAVRRMQKRIEKNDPHASIKSFVEESILPKDKQIREFYGEYIRFTPINLAWMVARDACFLFEFLVTYVGSSDIGTHFREAEVTAFSWRYDAVFDVSYQNPMREGLMEDILLLENQIPLWVLKDLLQIEMGSTEAANEKLNELMDLLHGLAVRHNVFMWYTPYPYNTSCHVLEVLYHGMLDRNVSSYEDGEALKLLPSRNRMEICFKNYVDSMKGICGNLFKLCLRFHSTNTSRRKVQQTPPSPDNSMEISYTNGVNSVKPIRGHWCKMCLGLPSSNASPDKAVKLGFLKLPTASELVRGGVKIHPVFSEGRPTRTGSAIEWLRFDEKTSTLYIPQMRVTVQSDSVMRNIIAMEVSIEKKYSPRPFTQFAIFMDELIDSEEDVAVLRKAEVINNFLGSNQQVADLFNSLAKGITYDDGCKVIVDARIGLHIYTKRKYKILWSELVSAYFSNPWLITGSVAAALLLLMIVAQVFLLSSVARAFL